MSNAPIMYYVCQTTCTEFGVATVVKAGQDLELVKQLASKSDIVLNAADADDEALTDAVLAGCKLHFENTGAKTLLIHTSGTAVLADEAEGVFSATATVYDVGFLSVSCFFKYSFL